MGSKADEILPSFELTEDELKDIKVVKSKFEDYFIVRRNVIFERANFNNRKQEHGEPVDHFITALYGLAEHCKYGTLREEMIRDRIVVGLRDDKLSEKLQMDASLTLVKAVNQARQSEAVKGQQHAIRNPSSVDSDDVDSVKSSKGKRWNQRRKPHPYKSEPAKKISDNKSTMGRPNSQRSRYGTSSRCSWCGHSPNHDRANCPAYDAVCNASYKVGHFAKVCRSKGSQRRPKK